MSDVNIELRDALLHSIKQQKLLQTKVMNLEGRSCRNYIRVYGIKEDAVGNSMLTFIDNFLKTELALHRSRFCTSPAYRGERQT